MPSIPVQIFQPGEETQAAEFLYPQRAAGKVAAAFVYSRPPSATSAHPAFRDPWADWDLSAPQDEPKIQSDRLWGTLYVIMPDSYGITQDGHRTLQQQFNIAYFHQRLQIVLSMRDTDIEAAANLLAETILPYPESRDDVAR